MNGSGTATGTGATHGDLSYIYARAGFLLAQDRHNQIALAAEYGRERMEIDAYSEPLSPQNPFQSTVAAGADTTDLAKLRLQWSHRFSPSVDGTLWVAGVHGFNRSTDLIATVPGIGVLAPTNTGDLNWAEYGLRIGYKLAKGITLDTFADGVSGGRGIDTRVHTGLALRFQY